MHNPSLRKFAIDKPLSSKGEGFINGKLLMTEDKGCMLVIII